LQTANGNGPVTEPDVRAAYEALHAGVLGREWDLDSIFFAALSAGRELLPERPPGTGKSTITRTATSRRIWLVFVEGNADLSPSSPLGA
jgi:MoxR-like ATPase